MGDPKQPRKEWSKPSQRWNAARIEEEKSLIKEYGLKNKQEIWKAAALLRRFTRNVKRLVPLKGEQAEKEKMQLLNKVRELGLVGGTAKLEDVLGLNIKNILDRRLQSIVFKKKLANTVVQARQFISHEHISVEGKKMSIPSYIVPAKAEASIYFAGDSSLSNAAHPEIAKITQKNSGKKSEAKTEK